LIVGVLRKFIVWLYS